MAYRYLATFKDGSTHEIKRSGISDYAFAWQVSTGGNGFSRTAHNAQKTAEQYAGYARERGQPVTVEVVPVERFELQSRKPKAAA